MYTSTFPQEQETQETHQDALLAGAKAAAWSHLQALRAHFEQGIAALERAKLRRALGLFVAPGKAASASSLTTECSLYMLRIRAIEDGAILTIDP